MRGETYRSLERESMNVMMMGFAFSFLVIGGSWMIGHGAASGKPLSIGIGSISAIIGAVLLVMNFPVTLAADWIFYAVISGCAIWAGMAGAAYRVE